VHKIHFVNLHIRVQYYKPASLFGLTVEGLFYFNISEVSCLRRDLIGFPFSSQEIYSPCSVFDLVMMGRYFGISDGQDALLQGIDSVVQAFQ